jgi:hypothetical protein
MERSRPLIVALIAVLFVGACGGIRSTATSGPTLPGESPSSTDGSSGPPASQVSSPEASPSPLPGMAFAPGTAVEVVAVELNLRRQPTTSARRVSVLERGDVVVISPVDNLAYGWGPVRANGFDWYPVVRVVTPDGRLPRLPEHPVIPLDGEPVSGWIAAGEGSKPYIRALPPRCPAVADLASVAGMLPAERTACFGANPLVLEGTYGCFGCGALAFGTYTPAWLATPFELEFLSLDPSVTFGPLALRFPPDGPERPPLGSIIRVTVHLFDARAEGCSIVDGEGAAAVTVPAETARQFCRERLAVESFEVLGTDPRFPTS